MVWVLIVILVLISFVFSGVETALLSITRARLRHHAEQGNSAASRLPMAREMAGLADRLAP